MAMRSLKIDFYLYRVLILVETRVKFVRVVVSRYFFFGLELQPGSGLNLHIVVFYETAGGVYQEVQTECFGAQDVDIFFL